MEIVFFIAAAVAIAATVMVITRANAIHALLYFIVSLLASALVLYTMGAPFVAALEVIIYAGAIMVLFIFVVMMLNLGPEAAEQENAWMSSHSWAGPVVLAVILLAELIYMMVGMSPSPLALESVEPDVVGLALYGPYVIGAELAALLLLAGLVGAYHLGRRIDV